MFIWIFGSNNSEYTLFCLIEGYTNLDLILVAVDNAETTNLVMSDKIVNLIS